jgi:CRP/FNR family transcriptional regulator, cyclic AMP receptor protein
MSTDPNYLRDVSCFRDLSDEQLNSLAQISDALCYPAGHTLFEEGKPGERLFFLVKGDVEVLYQIGEAGQVHVDTLSGQEIAGCSALVEPYAYTATERSLTEVEVLEIDAEALRNLMREDCSLGFAIQQHVIAFLMDRILNFRLGS